MDAASPVYDIAIVGAGPAGASAALYAARADLRTLVLDRSLTAGALGMAGTIANYPGVGDGPTGAELVKRMRDHAASFGAEFVESQVISSDLKADPKSLVASTGLYEARAVILATGRMGRKNRVAGEEEFLGRGVSYCATCDAAFFRGKTVAVVGSNEHAIEEATFTTRFASRLLFCAQGERLHAPDDLVEELRSRKGVELLLGRRLKRIVGEKVVRGIVVEANGKEEEHAVDGVFIFLTGNAPILDFTGGAIEVPQEGCLRVGADRATAIAGVYAAGDLNCNYIQQAVVAAAEGAIAAMAAEQYLRRRKKAKSDWA